MAEKGDVHFNETFNSGMKSGKEESHFSTLIRFVAVVLNLSFHISVLIITISLCLSLWRAGLKKTGMHAFFCTLGYVFFVAEGINTRYSYNPLFWDFHRLTNVLIHIIMVTCGGLLAVAGTAKIFFSVDIHYTSFHGKIGIASLVMLLLNIVSGTCYIASAVILDDLRLLHKFLGISSFALGMYSQLTGYNSGYFRRNFVRIRLYKILTFGVLIVGALHPFDVLLDAIETSLQFN